jgi:hypothetical protein
LGSFACWESQDILFFGVYFLERRLSSVCKDSIPVRIRDS